MNAAAQRGFLLAAWRRRRLPRAASTTQFADSLFVARRREGQRRSAARWSAWGAAAGAVAGLVAFAPAAWLAAGLAGATQGRLLLADAEGTVWSGSAVAVLSGGEGSRDARALPGRLQWQLAPGLGHLRLSLQQACCINDSLDIRLRPGLGTLQIDVAPRPGWVAQWPASLLTGLGTPWNTLELTGELRLVVAQPLVLQWVQGRWRLQGSTQLELHDVASRLSGLPRLGSYRLDVRSDDAAGTAQLNLTTTDGALLLSGNGSFGPAGLRLRGEASARPGDEAALSNLLNIIGRRNGMRAIISIG